MWHNNPLHKFVPDPAAFAPAWLKKWQKDDCEFRSFRITTAMIENEPVRTYGVIGFPAKTAGRRPAILHLHGGGQTASPDNVLYHVRRGYVAMTFDWTGAKEGRDPDLITHYPDTVAKQPEHYLGELEKNGLERSHLFLAVKATRCCLAFLAAMAEVDPDRIGFYGVSWGGFLAWLVNGTDSIPKCAVPIYGSGGIHWPGHVHNHIWNSLKDGTRQLWASVLEPAGYANCQKAPVLHISPTNDFFGGFETAAQLLPTLAVDWRGDFTPNCNHHFDLGSARLVERWFDVHLKKSGPLPAAPEVKIKVLDHSTLEITTTGSAPDHTLWYSCGRAHYHTRCWLSAANWKADGEQLTMQLPVAGETWLYVRYHDPVAGFKISSMPMRMALPAPIIKKKKVLYDKSFKGDGWALNLGTELFADTESKAKPYFDRHGLNFRLADGKFNKLIYFGPANPLTPPPAQCRGIEVMVKGAAKLVLECLPAAIEERGEPFASEAAQPLDGPNRFLLDSFTNGKGRKLESFSTIGVLALRGEIRANETLQVSRIKWL